MALSQREELTAQFYEWEIRGRGWQCADYSVQLEPPFHPFFHHYIPTPYTDDTKYPTLLSRFADIFRTPQPVPVIKQNEPLPTELYPFLDEDELIGYVISYTKHSKPSLELMEQCLIMLSGIDAPISFEIIADSTSVAVQIVARQRFTAFLYSQLKIFFPDVGIVPIAEIDAIFNPDLSVYTVDFGMYEEYMRPINTSNSHTDSLVGFWGICEQLKYNERVVLQVLFTATVNQWAGSIERSVSDGKKGAFFIDGPEMPGLAKEKCSKPLFAVAMRVLTQADVLEDAGILLNQVAYTITRASTSPHNALVALPTDGYAIEQRIDDIALRQSHRAGMLLNSRELAIFAHLPNGAVSKKLIAHHRSTKAAPPSLIGLPYCLGINSHQGVEHNVGIDILQRLRHVHLIGATGTGKSTLLHSLIMQDVSSNTGLCVIDPHGDLVDRVLFDIPEHRVQDVVLIDPSDAEFSIGLNILSAHSDLERELLASDLVALFRRFSTSWGDQMNSVFANAVSAFVYNTQIGTLADMRKFFVEQSFRNTILSHCTDPDIVYYWHKEYPLLKSSSVGSILTRLDSFLRPKVIRNMVSQQQSLNFGELMDSNKIVLVKLSQGLLGEENSYLLGAFIVSKLQQIAMSRQAQVASERIPFYCYIDEFQHFITPSMETILSGTRKYGLGLVLSHQNMEQVSSLDGKIAESVMGNAGTRICFRLGDTDAKRLQQGFNSFSADDLQNLHTGEAIVRVNTAEQDFNVSVIPYTSSDTNYKEAIVAHSRATYSVPIVRTVQTPILPIAQIAPIPTPPFVVPPIIAEPKHKEVREHRYLQTFIKKLAEEHGYKANIEIPTPDGVGQVDILLEKDGQSIAIEISVTNTARYELHNIQKCIMAGYGTVVLCTNSQSKIQQLQALTKAALTTSEQQQLRIITVEQVPDLFISATPTQEVTTFKGYRVKVQYEQGASTKQDIIKRIIQNVRPTK
jgi:hypothetical protein